MNWSSVEELAWVKVLNGCVVTIDFGVCSFQILLNKCLHIYKQTAHSNRTDICLKMARCLGIVINSHNGLWALAQAVNRCMLIWGQKVLVSHLFHQVESFFSSSHDAHLLASWVHCTQSRKYPQKFLDHSIAVSLFRKWA